MKSARRRAREYAVQGLYQWQLAGTRVGDIERSLAEDSEFAEADRTLFVQLLHGASSNVEALEAALRPALDRAPDVLSPIERAILLLATFEFVHMPETPYRVVINEAIELAKTFGGTDGHKYVNGVLDKLAPTLRPHEKAGARNRAQ